ncbi:MAG: tripartite tricarboxylate transporter substrate binding protein [Betaproteobacteria bacterium]|nr:tripartite tricarboxylate transporter substrate binding protein [Betaproteobacteria bacterium]
MRLVRSALALLSLLFSFGVLAAFPDKPIKLIIGFPPGGPLDTHARLLVDKLQQSLGQPVIVDYKAGAGGSIGADFVAKSPADGYTLLVANTGTMVINPPLYASLPYQTLRDFAPVARTAQQPLALVVNNEVPVKTLAEFIAYAKKNPGKVNYGSAGNGGISHLVPEMFKQAAGIDMLHVPYKGTAPAFVDLLAGQVQFMAESIPQVSQYVKGGKVRALALTAAERNPALPEVPTMAEAGVKNFVVVGFYGILAPANTPKDVVAKLSLAFRDALESAEVKMRMTQSGADPAYLDAEKFTAYLQTESVRWAAAVKAAGVKLD